MTINPVLNSVSAALAQQTSTSSVRAAVQTSGVSDNPPVTPASDSLPSQSVVQTASLVTASSGLAQLGSFLEVAQAGTEQVGNALQQLVTLANQVVSPAPGTDLTGLDSEFQQILAQIDQTASDTTFGGSPILNGSLTISSGSGQSAPSQNAPAAPAPALSLPNLSTEGLFGTTALDISTPQNAIAAITALGNAQETVTQTESNISDVQTQLSFATASVGTALANTEAAASTLTESDLESSGDQPDLSSELLNNPSLSAAAQTGNLSGNLLSLIQE